MKPQASQPSTQNHEISFRLLCGIIVIICLVAPGSIISVLAVALFRYISTLGFVTRRLAAVTTNESECIACLESVPATSIYMAPCENSHGYCQTCVGHLFCEALADDSLFPPRCCRTTFPIDEVRDMLKFEVVQSFEVKMLEINSADPTYCANPVCSTFIPPSRIHGTTAECPRCETHTCTSCKAITHSEGCVEALDDLVAQAAEVAEWKRCYQCHALIGKTGWMRPHHVSLPTNHSFPAPPKRRSVTDTNPRPSAVTVAHNSATVAAPAGKPATAPATPPLQTTLQYHVQKRHNNRAAMNGTTTATPSGKLKKTSTVATGIANMIGNGFEQRGRGTGAATVKR